MNATIIWNELVIPLHNNIVSGLRLVSEIENELMLCQECVARSASGAFVPFGMEGAKSEGHLHDVEKVDLIYSLGARSANFRP